MMNLRLPLLLLGCCVAAVPASADQWHSTAGSRFHFEATIESVATPGEFKNFAVLFDFDPAHPDASKLRVTVDLTAADLGDPDMNAALFDAAWFDTAQFAEAVFDSVAVAEQSPGHYLASGTLDLKGVQKTIAVPFAWVSAADTASMAGELTLDRTEFAVGSGEWASGGTIGIPVRLKFVVQLARQH
jgi:polyisoprenoid-binding protein YceI